MDKYSRISGFGPEVDEWDALNKYAAYKSYADALEKRKKTLNAQSLIKEELNK